MLYVFTYSRPFSVHCQAIGTPQKLFWCRTQLLLKYFFLAVMSGYHVTFSRIPNGVNAQQQRSREELVVCRRRTGSASLAAANLARCWPLLVRVLTQYSSNDRIAEKTGRAIKQALQTSRTSSAALLPQVVETVVQQFQQSRHPCMLYIASELLKMYGADQQYQAPLGEILLTYFVSLLLTRMCHGWLQPAQATGMDFE